jgi:hypothetical protein
MSQKQGRRAHGSPPRRQIKKKKQGRVIKQHGWFMRACVAWFMRVRVFGFAYGRLCASGTPGEKVDGPALMMGLSPSNYPQTKNPKSGKMEQANEATKAALTF